MAKNINVENSNNNSGFTLVETVLVIVVLIIIGVVGYGVFSRSKKSNTSHSPPPTSSHSEQQTSKPVEDKLEIQNFGLASMDSVDVTTNALREYQSKGLKGFYFFGDKLSGGRTNPNFEFASLKAGTQIISAIDGVVGNIKEQNEGGKDYEVFIMPSENSAWVIAYDHLTGLKVKKGDKVKVGDVLGQPAMQNNGLLHFEFQINKEGQDSTHYCPSTLLASSVRDKQLADLKAMMNSWESKTGIELYDIDSQDPVGCLKKTLTPAEAEGQQ